MNSYKYIIYKKITKNFFLMSFIKEDVEQTNKIITYGSVISIYYSEESESYLFSNGFSENNIYVTNISKLNDENNKSNSKKRDKTLHYSSCLFMILPSFSNNLKQDALNLLKKYKENNEFSLTSGHAISLKKINETKAKIISEYRSNYDIFKKFSKKPMTFSQNFQLIHLDSFKYLACWDLEADNEKENFKLQLDDYPSDRTIFKFLPAYNYQKDADQIINENETVCIAHINRSLRKEVFLHVSKEISSLQQRLAAFSNKDRVIKEKFITRSSLVKEANASLDEKSMWKMRIFSTELEEESMFLKSGDLIWIYHSEMNASLSANKKTSALQLFHLKRKDRLEEENLRENEKDFSEKENVHVNFIKNFSFEEKFEDFQGNTCGVWIIEGLDSKKGEKIQYGENFRFRHLRTGGYLTVNNNFSKENGKKFGLTLHKDKITRTKADEKLRKNSFFNFFPIISLLNGAGSKYVPLNSFTYVRNANTKKWLDAVVNEKEEINGENDANEEFIVPVLKEEFSEQEIFRIHKAPVDLIWELKFLNSFYPKLEGFNDELIEFNVNLFKFYYFFYLNTLIFWIENE